MCEKEICKNRLADLFGSHVRIADLNQVPQFSYPPTREAQNFGR